MKTDVLVVGGGTADGIAAEGRAVLALAEGVLHLLTEAVQVELQRAQGFNILFTGHHEETAFFLFSANFQISESAGLYAGNMDVYFPKRFRRQSSN